MRNPDRGLTAAATRFALAAFAVWLVHIAAPSGTDWLKYVWTGLLGIAVALVLVWYGWRIRHRQGGANRRDALASFRNTGVADSCLDRRPGPTDRASLRHHGQSKV
jgi:hypothetical protein